MQRYTVQDVAWQDNSQLIMKGTHYMERDTEMDSTGHSRHVMVQDPHYTGQDTAEDRM